MKYRYIASKPDGGVVEGNVDMANVQAVLQFLAKSNLKPISVKGLDENRVSVFKGTIKIDDQIFLTKYLALMLKIGTGLLEAINILIADFRKPAVRDFLFEVRSNLEQGRPFYTTFAKYPKVFGNVYVNLVKAGEESGNLEKVFADLTESLQKQKDLRDTVRGAMIYPILLFSGSILILFFLVTFALPKISNVFAEGGFKPPAFSQAVFSVGAFFNTYGLYIAGFLGLVGVIIFVMRRSSLTFLKFSSEIFSDVPVVKNVLKKMALQRFAATLASLVRAGMPITKALEITSEAVANRELKVALVRISQEGLAKGLTIGEAFRRESAFPSTVTNLIAISEKAGHLDEVLETLSAFYAKEIDASVKQLVAFLEPALLVFIGLIVGVIALAVIIPIYQLTTSF